MREKRKEREEIRKRPPTKNSFALWQGEEIEFKKCSSDEVESL